MKRVKSRLDQIKSDLQVRNFPIAAIKPDPRNARKHGSEQIDRLAAVIRELGFTNPILLDEQLTILCGHARREAALRVPMENVPCIVIDGLSSAEKKALAIADNQLGDLSSFDQDRLALVLAEIEIECPEFDMELTGFSTGEVDLIIGADGLGHIDFQAQYQQDPTPVGGLLIKAEHLRHRYPPNFNFAGGRVVMSLDTATKTNPQNDYSVCSVLVQKPLGHYVRHVWREKVTYPELKDAMIELYNQLRPEIFLIEDSGNGAALIQELRSLGVPITSCQPSTNKQARFIPCTAFFSSGLVWLPEEAPWLSDLVKELLAFPNSKHDDQADSLSQYFTYFRELGVGFRYHGLDDPISSGVQTLYDVNAAFGRASNQPTPPGPGRER